MPIIMHDKKPSGLTGNQIDKLAEKAGFCLFDRQHTRNHVYLVIDHRHFIDMQKYHDRYELNYRQLLVINYDPRTREFAMPMANGRPLKWRVQGNWVESLIPSPDHYFIEPGGCPFWMYWDKTNLWTLCARDWKCKLGGKVPLPFPSKTPSFPEVSWEVIEARSDKLRDVAKAEYAAKMGLAAPPKVAVPPKSVPVPEPTPSMYEKSNDGPGLSDDRFWDGLGFVT
jgi:hypothetical protein